MDSYHGRLDRLGDRPILSTYITGIVTRWEQNNETPPPPSTIDPDAARAMARATRAAEADEEDYFNASDEEDVKPPAPVHDIRLPSKRKKASQAGGPHKRSNSGAGASPAKPAATLGLVDYDDNSDSDSSAGGQSPRLRSQSTAGQAGSSSPKLAGSSPKAAARAAEELEEEMGDVTMKMRAKRQREEEEEEGFAGLVGKPAGGAGVGAGAKGAGHTPKRSPSPSGGAKDKEKEKGGGAKREGTPGKRGGIRVNLFGMGKKFGKGEEGGKGQG